MTAKMTRRQKRKMIAQLVLFLVGLGGFFLIINRIGTLDGDYITISTQLTLNVKVCVSGFALITLAISLYKNLFND